jgi:hypothetical protein
VNGVDRISSLRQQLLRVLPSISRVPIQGSEREADVDYGDVLGKPEFKVLLNNRWGVNVYPV